MRSREVGGSQSPPRRPLRLLGLHRRRQRRRRWTRAQREEGQSYGSPHLCRGGHQLTRVDLCRWDTLLFLPPLLDSHGASPILCNPRLPSNASDPTTIRSVFTLPMADVDLFLNFGAVQRRGGGRDTKLNVAPTAQVSVVPWLEEEAGVDWEEGIVAVVVERDAKDGLEVCQMGGRGVQGVGVFVSLETRQDELASLRRAPS